MKQENLISVKQVDIRVKFPLQRNNESYVSNISTRIYSTRSDEYFGLLQD